MWKAWLNLIIGIWLILSGFSSGLQTIPNLIVVGILALVFGFILLRKWEGLINGILGIWLLLSGLALGIITNTNFLWVGIIMTVISLISIYHLHQESLSAHKTA